MPVRADEPVILVLGDSLSAAYGLPVEQGWVQLLTQRLEDEGYPHRVRNASLSGETTRGGLDRLRTALQTHDPSLVIIELGANDGLRGMPLDEMAANFEEMIALARAHGARPLVVRMRLPTNYGPAYTKKFAEVYARIGDSSEVTLTPFMLEGFAGDPKYFLDDGLHPNAAAQPRILDTLWPAIEPLLRAPATAERVD